MAMLRFVAFAVCVVSLTSAMDLPGAKKMLSGMSSIGEVEEFIIENGDAMSEMRGPVTAQRMAEAFRPISAEGAKKCAMGMAMMDKTSAMVQKVMDDLKDETQGEGLEEEVFGSLDAAVDSHEEEEIDCDRVRDTSTVDGIEFQAANGECNNVIHPEWGAREANFLRIAPPKYGGIVIGGNEIGPRVDRPTQFRANRLLPGARTISVEFHGDQANNDNDHSYFLMQWGQFLDHDVTLTPTIPNSGCDTVGTLSANCFNIKIPSGDPQFDQGDIFVRKEIPLTRSAASDRLNPFFTREQFNEITAFIDASNVYGATQERQEQLREETPLGSGALMRTIETDDGSALPLEIDNFENEVCQGKLPLCFQAGDVRASEQIFLTLTHTLWVIEHNRIVVILKKLNPGWGDERLFQETRRIIASVHQHIAFDEYLPNLIGGGIHKLLVPPYQGLNPDMNPGMFNEFATASYRMGHSQLRNQLARLGPDFGLLSEIDFRQAFFQPARYLTELEGPDAAYDNYVRGLLDRNSQQIDQFISEELNNHLFEPVSVAGTPTGPGLDLASLNIQRGRDHGLASYLTVRKQAVNYLTTAGVPIPYPIIKFSILKQLAAIYGKRFLAQIDLWVGGLAEVALETALPADKRDGGQLGPTLTFVITKQFINVRDGDRFFFRNPNVNFFDSNKPAVPVLTPAQLASIEATSLSTFVCSTVNKPDVMKIQPQAFRFPNTRDSLATPYPPGTTNGRQLCSKVIELPGSKCLDLSPWANDGKGCADVWHPFVCSLFFHLGGCSGSGGIGYYLQNQFDVRENCALTCNACKSPRVCFMSDL